MTQEIYRAYLRHERFSHKDSTYSLCNFHFQKGKGLRNEAINAWLLIQQDMDCPDRTRVKEKLLCNEMLHLFTYPRKNMLFTFIFILCVISRSHYMLFMWKRHFYMSKPSYFRNQELLRFYTFIQYRYQPEIQTTFSIIT